MQELLRAKIRGDSALLLYGPFWVCVRALSEADRFERRPAFHNGELRWTLAKLDYDKRDVEIVGAARADTRSSGMDRLCHYIRRDRCQSLVGHGLRPIHRPDRRGAWVGFRTAAGDVLLGRKGLIALAAIDALMGKEF